MIDRKPFGSTGHLSSVTIFGGAALSDVIQEEADGALRLLLEHGVNHIDTAASYGDSELRIGPWMEQHRGDFFLATKTGRRTYDEAKAEFGESLRRLRVRNVDLLQLHNLVHPDDWDAAMGENGALKAVVEARDQGLTRFIGVTGHGLLAPAMHIRSIRRFPFDSVLLPLNYVMYREERYRKDFDTLARECMDRGIAVQTIKSVTRGPWGDRARTTSTWYEPLANQEGIDFAVSWLLGHGWFFLNTSSDLGVLKKILIAAEKRLAMPSEDQMENLVQKECMSRLFVS